MRLRGRWRPGRKAIRLISLDVLRGLTVAGMILVNSAAAMKYGAEANVAPILLHVSWEGLTLADLVFPGFLTMVGIAIPFSMRDAAFDSRLRRHIFGRPGRLLLLSSEERREGKEGGST